VVPVRSDEDPDDALEAVMRTLAVSARQANLARVAVLEDALARVEAATLTSGQRDAAVAAAHQVAGSAGTFGRRRSSTLAAELEQWFRVAPPDAGVERARTLLTELRADLSADHQDEV
jgi:HPt (histidine-containing phosphotransfer) domain-containing protein